MRKHTVLYSSYKNMMTAHKIIRLSLNESVDVFFHLSDPSTGVRETSFSAIQ